LTGSRPIAGQHNTEIPLLHPEHAIIWVRTLKGEKNEEKEERYEEQKKGEEEGLKEE
jgi:hypothetical protein